MAVRRRARMTPLLEKADGSFEAVYRAGLVRVEFEHGLFADGTELITLKWNGKPIAQQSALYRYVPWSPDSIMNLIDEHRDNLIERVINTDPNDGDPNWGIF